MSQYRKYMLKLWKQARDIAAQLRLWTTSFICFLINLTMRVCKLYSLDNSTIT
jgi:hypothetical protein